MHIPVLKSEIIECFKDRSGALVDLTIGAGGHALAIMEANPDIKIIGFDRDEEAINVASELGLSVTHSSMSEAISKLISLPPSIPIVGLMADLGMSSMQLDSAGRGFGLKSSGLSMKMDEGALIPDAKDLINNLSIYQLEEIFRDYGEIKEYKKLSRLINDRRQKKLFESALELSEFINSNIKIRRSISCATLAFQALRIKVNNELEELKYLLHALPYFKGARIAIISFHSLEDRLIKRAFNDLIKSCICSPDALKCSCGNNNAKARLINKKPLQATAEELINSPRSRSAKLRMIDIF